MQISCRHNYLGFDVHGKPVYMVCGRAHLVDCYYCYECGKMCVCVTGYPSLAKATYGILLNIAAQAAPRPSRWLHLLRDYAHHHYLPVYPVSFPKKISMILVWILNSFYLGCAHIVSFLNVASS